MYVQSLQARGKVNHVQYIIFFYNLLKLHSQKKEFVTVTELKIELSGYGKHFSKEEFKKNMFCKLNMK